VQLENSFTVPVPLDEAWRVLLDIERIAPCMPGAALDSVDGDDFTGRVKVKLGPINLTYQGKASFVEKDEAAHRAVIDAKGKDQRGNGTAAATITAKLAAEGAITRVNVLTDLNITGRPAQFGRGVMTDVGNKLLGQFADKLATQLGEGDAQGNADRASAAAEESAAQKVATTAAGAVEEIAASAEGLAGNGAAGQAVKKAAAGTRKAAAAATDTVSATSTVEPATSRSAKKAAPAKKAVPATTDPAEAVPAAADSTTAATEAAPAGGDASPAATDAVPGPDTSQSAAEIALAAMEAAQGATDTAAVDAAPPKAPSGPPSGPTAPPSRPATGAPVRSVPSAGPRTITRPQEEPEPIDLLEVAGGAAMARYAAPATGITGLLLVLIFLLLRRRHGDDALGRLR
jgi:carbon monoxide dehydrogenase subunit G